MYHLVYTSHAAKEFSESDLIGLLKESREFNKENHISGMLLYLEGKFIQVLEGDKSTVELLYSKIKKDRRHARVMTVLQGNSSNLLFSGWSMGFKKLSFEDARDLSGFKDIDIFFKENMTKEESNIVLVFLELFYQQNKVDYAEL